VALVFALTGAQPAAPTPSQVFVDLMATTTIQNAAELETKLKQAIDQLTNITDMWESARESHTYAMLPVDIALRKRELDEALAKLKNYSGKLENDEAKYKKYEELSTQLEKAKDTAQQTPSNANNKMVRELELNVQMAEAEIREYVLLKKGITEAQKNFDDANKADALTLVRRNARKQLGDRLALAVRRLLSDANAPVLTKQSVVVFIGEQGLKARITELLTELPRGSTGQFAQQFAPELMQLVADAPTPALARSAFVALLQVYPKAEMIYQAEKSLLLSPQVERQRMGAELLDQYMKQIERAIADDATARLELYGTWRDQNVVSENKLAILELASLQMASTDTTTRLYCLEAYRLALKIMGNNPAQTAPKELEKLYELMLTHSGPLFAAAKYTDVKTQVQISNILRSATRLRLLVLDKATEKATDQAKLTGFFTVAKALLVSADTDAQYNTLEAIDKLGAVAFPIASEVAACADSRNLFSRWLVARVLKRFAAQAPVVAIAALQKLVQDTDLNVRAEAVEAAVAYGAAASAVVPALATQAVKGDAVSRKQILEALPLWANETTHILPALQTSFTHTDASVRKTAAESAGKLGAAARPLVAALQVLLNDRSDEVRGAASTALLTILRP
jgi:hypothetical protein